MGFFDGNPARRRLQEAVTLLKEERALLLKGDLKGLARHDKRRAQLMRDLPDLNADDLAEQEPLVEEVRALARRNGRLLEAFLAGARAARDRLKAIAASLESMGAYRRDGSRIKGPPAEQTTSRRL